MRAWFPLLIARLLRQLMMRSFWRGSWRRSRIWYRRWPKRKREKWQISQFPIRQPKSLITETATTNTQKNANPLTRNGSSKVTQNPNQEQTPQIAKVDKT